MAGDVSFVSRFDLTVEHINDILVRLQPNVEVDVAALGVPFDWRKLGENRVGLDLASRLDQPSASGKSLDQLTGERFLKFIRMRIGVKTSKAYNDVDLENWILILGPK